MRNFQDIAIGFGQKQQMDRILRHVQTNICQTGRNSKQNSTKQLILLFFLQSPSVLSSVAKYRYVNCFLVEQI